MKMNHNFSNIAQSYLFSTIAKKVADYTAANPDKNVIRLGIGDVTLPLPQVAIDAMHAAVDEQSKQGTFRGYGPEQGYDFLKESIQAYYGMRD
ncbi:MAG: LL-diaminopimelate aminotransferase, partial [Butyricicoccus sp.]